MGSTIARPMIDHRPLYLADLVLDVHLELVR